jgi:hypothetical protein
MEHSTGGDRRFGAGDPMHANHQEYLRLVRRDERNDETIGWS